MRKINVLLIIQAIVHDCYKKVIDDDDDDDHEHVQWDFTVRYLKSV